MTGLWHEAARRLRGHRRDASLIAAVRLSVLLLLLLCGRTAQVRLLPDADFTGAVNLWDLFLPCCLLFSLLAATPLRAQTIMQLGAITGLLDENDIGFLESSSRMWLWLRALHARLLGGFMLLLSAIPALAALVAAKSVWLLIPPEQEGLLPLLTVLHLLMLAAAAFLLPLRVFAACTALPYCFLKMPHASALRVLLLSFRVTRRQTAGIVMMRLLAAPWLLLPVTAIYVLPTLLTAEFIRGSRGWRHMQPRRSGRFAGLELHSA
ncbi:MAG: hypothetical protein IJ060_00265 [Oscillospiraceae bacterium]|nr:hypothetical protein [Oscillospiraceae bacterium]